MESLSSVGIFSALVCFLVAAAGAQVPPPGGYYTTRYDHVDIENILNQKRLVYYYSACLLDKGPCTAQGIEFKHILPEALRTNCLRCTEKQKFVTIKTLRRLSKEYPDVWKQLSAAWDPTGEYWKRLENSGRTNGLVPEFAGSASNVQNSPTVSPSSTVSSTSTSTTANPPEIIIGSRFGENEDAAQTPTTATTTTARPTTEATSQQVISSEKTTVKRSTTTKGPTTTMKRLIYNYDFAATSRPYDRQPAVGINLVIKGVNDIILSPITDLAGKVITVGTDIAGMVLNAIGVRRDK